MFRLRQLTALVLLTLWLPATQHCGFEAAGWLAAAAECCAEDSPCGQDGCELVEEGGYKLAASEIKVRAPQAVAPLYLVARVMSEPREFDLGQRARTEGGTPSEDAEPWQFAHRAAPLPGAPGWRTV